MDGVGSAAEGKGPPDIDVIMVTGLSQIETRRAGA